MKNLVQKAKAFLSFVSVAVPILIALFEAFTKIAEEWDKHKNEFTK